MQEAEAKRRILEGKRSQAVRRKLVERTPNSAAVRAKGKALSQEIAQTVALPHPIYIDSAEGCRMTDMDGNTYIDMTMGFGPCVLGLNPPAVSAAVAAQLAKGWHFGIPNARQAELADLVQRASPCAERVVFCNTGTEATLTAMRVARAFTGKPKVAVFDGCYHGAHDYALIHVDPASERSRPEGKAVGAGIPEAIGAETMMTLPYRDDAAFDLIRANKDTLAAVFIEPVQNSNPRLDCAEFLGNLRDVCRESDVLLCFDEVVTGFRIAFGGCQEHYGITPDLATYGKALAAGFPIGAVAGGREVMRCFSGRGGAPWIFSGGTFSGNPLSMTAGLAAMGEMRERKDTLYPHLMEEGHRLAREVNGFCRAHNFAAQLMAAGSMFYLRFQGSRIDSSRDLLEDGKWAEQEFYLHLLGHGVIIPGVHLAFISGAHTSADVDAIIDAFKRSFMDLREDGLL